MWLIIIRMSAPDPSPGDRRIAYLILAVSTFLLALNYISVADSRISLVDLDTGVALQISGGPANTSVNYPVAFDDEGFGVWLITDQGGEHNQLAWQSLQAGEPVEIITKDILWGVSAAVLSHDRRRMAFVTNEDGMSRVYLMDTKSRKYRQIDAVPTGLASSSG